MQRVKRLIWVPALMVILIQGLHAPILAQDIADTIQRQYTTIDSFKTAFSQKLTNAASGGSEQRNGTIWYHKPHKIRWETTHPEEELLVVHQNTVWDYFPAEEVAYKYSLQGKFESKTMLKFITGEVNLKQDFQIRNQGQDPKFSDWTKLRLVPKKPEPSLVMAYLWFEPQTNLIRQVLLVDFFGNGNQLTFKDLNLNVDIAPSRFTFQPPQDVQIMQGGGQSGQ